MVRARRKIRSLFVLALVLGALAGVAHAGPVQVFGSWATGDLGTSHNLGGAQYIGCYATTDPAGPPLMYCEANNGLGSFNFCYSTSVSMFNTLQTIQSSSDIQFGWDAYHSCNFFTVQNYSQPPGRKF
jgi:hypothetical protein